MVPTALHAVTGIAHDSPDTAAIHTLSPGLFDGTAQASPVALQAGFRSLFVVFVLFFLVTLAVHALAIVWTYSDAKKHSPQSPELWAVVVFFAPLLGVVLYLLVGRGDQSI